MSADLQHPALAVRPLLSPFDDFVSDAQLKALFNGTPLLIPPFDLVYRGHRTNSNRRQCSLPINAVSARSHRVRDRFSSGGLSFLLVLSPYPCFG